MSSDLSDRGKTSGLLEVLVIDDDTAFRRVLQLRLKSFMSSIKVTGIETLENARHLLQGGAEVFDLVVLDEHLPDGRGVDLLKEGWFENLAVLCVSSDDSPEIPGQTIKAGAAYFLNKIQISEPLFEHLVNGVIDRNKIQRQLGEAKLNQAVIDTVRTLVATLRHEIKNPLGVVLGAAHLIGSAESVSTDQKRAAELVESSGKRINHVLDQLCAAVEIQTVNKANMAVFQIPGDKEWK